MPSGRLENSISLNRNAFGEWGYWQEYGLQSEAGIGTRFVKVGQKWQGGDYPRLCRCSSPATSNKMISFRVHVGGKTPTWGRILQLVINGKIPLFFVSFPCETTLFL